MKHSPIIIRGGRAGIGIPLNADNFASACIPTVAEAMAVLAQHQVLGSSERMRSDSGEWAVSSPTVIIVFICIVIFFTMYADGGMNSSSSSSSISALPFTLHRDSSSSNLSLPRDNSSASINTMHKDLSSGSIGSIETSVDTQQQQQNSSEPLRLRALTGNFSSAHVSKPSPPGAVGSGRKVVCSGDHDAYDSCVFALGGGAFRMPGHSTNMHR